MNVKKGLEGIVIDETRIAKVIPESNSLVYRGYTVQDLAKTCQFEEVAYLLWYEELPTENQLNSFCKKESSLRSLTKEAKEVIMSLSKKSHAMDVVRTGISFIGANDERTLETSRTINLEKAINLLAKIPTIIALDYRRKKSLPVLEPKEDLNLSENFFHMCFGEVPEKEVVKAFDVSLILYAEHSFNASTFTTRVISSTLSDLYSAVCGGVGALKGPLHGGANEQVMYMLEKIKDPSQAREWMLQALREKKKVMGFGHRVYKKGDSRVPTMKKYLEKLSEIRGEKKWLEISNELEKTMIEQKNIYPNLDFPAGPAYYLMGFEIEMFTPVFVMSRIIGWCAHIMEQIDNNRIIRPLSSYTGPSERKIIPREKRS